MKVLLCGVVLAAATAFVQTAPAAKPFKGANLIMVSTPDSLRVAVRKIKDVLLAQGYQLDSVAADRLTTKGRTFGPLPLDGAVTVHVFQVRAYATPQGAALALTGQYSQDLNPKYHLTFPMRWLAPQSPAYNQVCFTHAEKIAKAYPQARVSYQQRP